MSAQPDPSPAPLPLAVQLYSLRNLPHSLDEQLAQVAALGYRGVETLHDHGLSAAELGDLLQKHGLEAVSTHVALQKLESDLDGVIDFHRAIGNPVLAIPALPEARRPGDGDGWQKLGAQLGEIGARVTAEDMRLVYHNHAFEMEQFDGRLALDWLLAGAGEHLQWEPDLAWVVRGGGDPLALLRRYAGRCPRVHIKDLAPAGEGEDEKGFADVGYGTLDWQALLPAARAAGAEWYIVEHDLPRDALRTIQRSITYLQGMAAHL